MAGKSDLYRCVHALDRKLKDYFKGRQHGRARCRQARLDLLLLLETENVTSDLKKTVGRVYGTQKLLAEICQRVDANESAVVRALYDHIHLNAGLKSACSRWGCARSDPQAAMDLANDIGVQPGYFTRNMDPLDLGFLSEVLAEREHVVVHLGRRALEDMLLFTLEGYLVPKTKKTKFTEVYGLCLGMTRDEPIARRGGGKYWTRHIHVDRVTVQLRARATGDSVWPNPKSLEILLGASDILFPHLEVVGDFHSHPYKKAHIVQKWKGWEPSDTDDDYNTGWVQRMRSAGHSPKVAFVVAIGQKKKTQGQKPRQPTLPHVRFLQIQRSLVAVAAYRILADSRYDASKIELRLPTVYEA